MTSEKTTFNSPGEEAFQALRSLSPFKLFSDEELREVLPLCEIADFMKGDRIIREGEPSNNRVYFLLSGSVAVSINEKYILGLKRSGDIFGEMSLISDEPRSATVQADRPSRILAMNSALTFDPGEASYYKFRYLFSRMFNAILTDKLRITSERAKLYEDAMLQTREANAQSSTLREQIKENLQQIKLYSHLVESAHDAILIVNTSGIILQANLALQTEFGINPDRLLGLEIADMVSLTDYDPEIWDRTIQTGKGWNGEVVIKGEKGEDIPADCSISSVMGENNEPLAISVIFRNIRERKEAEAKIIQQSSELEKANQELTEMDALKDNFMCRLTIWKTLEERAKS